MDAVETYLLFSVHLVHCGANCTARTQLITKSLDQLYVISALLKTNVLMVPLKHQPVIAKVNH